MSNAVMNLCRPAQMPPTPKNVLMAIADRADDAGLAWPSIAGISEATCFSRTAVIDALKWLETAGLVSIVKAVGRNSRFTICTDRLAEHYPSGRRTGSSGEPVREADPTRTPAVPVRESDPSGSRTTTRPADAPHPSGSRTTPVREADPNHQEPPSNHQDEPPKREARARAVQLDLRLPELGRDLVSRPADVNAQVWSDWLTLRKAKKAPVTPTVLEDALAQAKKAEMTLDAFLRVWCARGSQGLQADWLKPAERGGTRHHRIATVESLTGRSDFIDVDYHEGLPNGLAGETP